MSAAEKDTCTFLWLEIFPCSNSFSLSPYLEQYCIFQTLTITQLCAAVHKLSELPDSATLQHHNSFFYLPPAPIFVAWPSLALCRICDEGSCGQQSGFQTDQSSHLTAG